MKKNTLVLIAAMVALIAGNVFAQVGTPVIVDSTGTDFQYYWYVGTPGQQICVDDQGTAHIAYCKTWCTVTDTGYQVMYANATAGTKIPIPSQMPTRNVQPAVVYIDGGHNGTPVYMMYGVGGRFYSYATWDEHHFQAMAKLNAAGTGIDTLGVQQDGAYYGGANFTNPFGMEVDNTNGIAHCILTTPQGFDVAYWNFDGTNFGEIFNIYSPDDGAGVPGLSPNEWYNGYLNTVTQGADLAISPDGSEIAIAGLHPRRQVDIVVASFYGDLFPTTWGDGVADGSVILLYDTLGQREGTNIPNNDPKPYCDLQISYDSNSNLHAVFDAAFIDVYIDTVSYFPGTDPAHDDWWRNHSSACVGDTNANFYDGSTHPKPQLLYWNNVSNTVTTLAECAYPLSGEEYKWNNYACWDSGGAGNWGKNYDDQIISNFDLVANKNPQPGEPDMVVVWEEMDAPVTQILDDYAFAKYYWAFTTDLKLSMLSGGVWSAPINLTKSPGVGEQSVSVYQDIIDNKIHMMYYRDNWPGRDRNLCYCADYQSDYVFWTSGGLHNSEPIRFDQTQLVEVVYQEVDLTGVAGIKENKQMPKEFDLAQNYPNPFNPTTKIAFTVPAGNVTLEIFDILGQKVKTLVNKSYTAGTYEEVWNGMNDAGKMVATGVYLYKLQSDAGVKVKKMLFQK